MDTHHLVWTLIPIAWLLPECQPESPANKQANIEQITKNSGMSKWRTFTFFIIVSFFHVSMPLNKALADVPAMSSERLIIMYSSFCPNSQVSFVQ